VFEKEGGMRARCTAEFCAFCAFCVGVFFASRLPCFCFPFPSSLVIIQVDG
jgi:hypothetical protein